MEGMILDETHEGINGKDLNPEFSNPSDLQSQINDKGNEEPGNKASTSGTTELHYFF
jgi:hypothetical protein